MALRNACNLAVRRQSLLFGDEESRSLAPLRMTVSNRSTTYCKAMVTLSLLVIPPIAI